MLKLVAFLCFFLSGASGLLFEVLWTRELGLVFGSTTLAMSTVLSVFMGGLALGSALAGRYVARLRHPLLIYAAVEAGVGLYALLVPLVLAHYPQVNFWLWKSVGDQFVALSLLRFFATAVLLLFPTTLMGATLPLLAEYLSRKERELQLTEATRALGASMEIGTLFSLNTAGAVLGTFLSGFQLLPRFGTQATNAVGAAVNLSLAVLVLVMTRYAAHVEARKKAQLAADLLAADVDEQDASERAQQPSGLLATDQPDLSPPTKLQRRLAVWAYAISGGTAMVYQVLWTRALAIVLGSSVYSFTLILIAFLLGLSFGAALITRLLPRFRRPVLVLSLVHALVLVTAAWSYFVLPRLPEVFLLILRGSAFNVDELLFTQLLLATFAVFPSTLAMGAVMPLTMRIYTAHRQSEGDKTAPQGAGHDVGVAYAWNTVGAIVGSFAAGFLVLPGLGLQRGLVGCGLLSAALSAMLMLVAEVGEGAKDAQKKRRTRRGIFAVAVVAAAALFAAFSPQWNLAHFSAGLFRISIAKQVIYLENRTLPELLYYRDGIATTVSVERWGKTVALKNNGKVDASNGDDMHTQIMVGLMPLLLHPQALVRPPRVAVIGYGSGVTIGAVTQFPIAHADVVELEPAVIEAGDRFFADVSHLPSRDPRVKVIVGDGRNFLTQSDAPYDVIVSEPSNPWITGVSNLFTTDYWQLAKNRLADDGIFCQWAQLYELSQPNIKTLLRSFMSVFPYTYVFAAEHQSSDVIMVASKRPLPLDVARLSQNFQVPQLRDELARADVSEPVDILADLLLTPDELPAFTVGAVLNTDDNARIEFRAPRDLLGYLRHESSVPRVHSPDWPYGRFERYLQNFGLPYDPPPSPAGTLEKPERRADFYARLGRALLRHGKSSSAARLLRRAEGTGGGQATTQLSQLMVLIASPKTQEPEEPLEPIWDGDEAHFLQALAEPPPSPGLSAVERTRIEKEWRNAIRLCRERRHILALRELREWPLRFVTALGFDARLLIGYLLYKSELNDDAIDHLEIPVRAAHKGDAAAVAWLKKFPGTLYYLSRAEYFNSDPEDAIDHLEEYLLVRGNTPAATPTP